MKTKQEQIDKMASIIFETINRENIDRFVEDKDGNLVSVETVGIEGIAEALIENGYGDVSEYKNRFEVVDKVLTETRAKLTKAEHDRDRYKTEIERLKYENTTLYEVKSNLLEENDKLLKDNVALILEKKQAQIDVLNKVKNCREATDSDCYPYLERIVNKLIKEVQNEQKG
mgnify:CR=1 FL=1